MGGWGPLIASQSRHTEGGRGGVWAAVLGSKERGWGWALCGRERRSAGDKPYGILSELGSSRCLGMGRWPRQISRERSSSLARGKDLAEQKRQVAMMKPTVEEHWQA